MGGYDGYLITYFVHKTRGQEVYHQLNAEIDGDQQCYFFQGNPVGCDKGGKKQRYKVVDNGLGDIAQIACIQGVAVAFQHGAAAGGNIGFHNIFVSSKTVFSVVIPGLMGAGFLHVRDRANCCAVLSAEGFAGWKLHVVLFPGKAFSTAFFFACIRPDNLVL
ncbi:hypothetical protein HMPREF1548_04208 [Clostridium sp. KLE 1755]|nr:hypothetical protein HMPREF1548_04208 [Clostridium sp. KLE 1755]